MVPVAPSLIPGMLALGLALSTSSRHQHPASVWHALKKSANTFHFQALQGTGTAIHLPTQPPHNADWKKKILNSFSMVLETLEQRDMKLLGGVEQFLFF